MGWGDRSCDSRLGRVVAFTSDGKGGWGKDWVTWKGYSAFWLQLVQGVMRTNAALHARVFAHRSGNTATFNYQITDPSGRPVDGLESTGVLGPADAAAGRASPTTAPAAAAAAPVRWRQTGPGEYQATVDVPADGRDRLVSMRLRKPGRPGDSGYKEVRYGAIVSADAGRELAETGPDLPALRAVAAAAGGLCTTDPADVAAACRSRRDLTTTHVPLWAWVMIAALFLWPVDVAVRKFQ